MYEASNRARWDHTAMLRLTLINLQAERKDQVSFEDCHPMVKARVRDFSEIKQQLLNGNGIRAKH